MTTAILLSGGVDSAAVAYWRRPDIAITVDYGQIVASAEKQAARSICGELAIEQVVVSANCAELGSGDLAGRPAARVAPVQEWWPYRNQLLVTLAGMVAIQRGVSELLLGIVAGDDSHRDGTSRFVSAISSLMEYQEGQVEVSAPAIDLSSIELVRSSEAPRSILSWCHSCHVSNLACGHCRGCLKHYLTWQGLGWDLH